MRQLSGGGMYVETLPVKGQANIGAGVEQIVISEFLITFAAQILPDQRQFQLVPLKLPAFGKSCVNTCKSLRCIAVIKSFHIANPVYSRAGLPALGHAVDCKCREIVFGG